MSGHENKNENKSSMEENKQQQELDSVSPPAIKSRERSHRKDDIVLNSTSVEKEKWSITLLDINSNADMRSNKQIVLNSVNQDVFTLQYASETLKGDKDIVFSAVKQRGYVLTYASEALKGDREIVLTAVKQCGWALQNASEALKGDREIVLAAVNQKGAALQYASDSLRADKEIVLAAVLNDFTALQYADDALKQDRDCLIAAGIWDKNYSAASIDSFIGIHGQKYIILSTRYSLRKDSKSVVTDVTRLLNKNQYVQDNNIEIFSPNAFCKSTCDEKWTRMSWPCRGTFKTCKFADHLKTGKPHDGCCWRYSYRWHLEEAKKRNGIMLQVVDKVRSGSIYEYDTIYKYELGDGQKIEKLMAEEIGIKVFRFYGPPLVYFRVSDVSYECIDILVSKIKTWYDDGCKDMTPCEVRFEEKVNESCV